MKSQFSISLDLIWWMVLSISYLSLHTLGMFSKLVAAGISFKWFHGQFFFSVKMDFGEVGLTKVLVRSTRRI